MIGFGQLILGVMAGLALIAFSLTPRTLDACAEALRDFAARLGWHPEMRLVMRPAVAVKRPAWMAVLGTAFIAIAMLGYVLR